MTSIKDVRGRGDDGAKRAVAALRRVMEELGYTPISIGLYVRLLVVGPQSPAKLRLAMGLRSGDLHVAANILIKDGLVYEDRDRSETIWYCRDPSMAWLSRAAAITWSATSTLRPLEDLPVTGRPEVDQRKELYLRGLGPALGLWSQHHSVVRHRHTHAPNTRILTQLAIEAVGVARSHVRSISASPKISVAADFWPVLMAKLNAGIRYTRLADAMEVYEHGLDVVERDLECGVNLSLGMRKDLVDYRGYLTDRRILVRYDSAPPGERPASGIMTADKYAINRFLRRFELLRRDSVPAQPAVDHLRELGNQLRDDAAGLGGDAVAWLDEMIRMGKFATTPTERSWSADERQRHADTLVRAGVARVNEQGLLLPAWPSPEDLLLKLR